MDRSIESHPVRLIPKHPPGRTTRKARGFEAEIAQRHAEGYSFASIRMMLADLGVHVSRATVQREIARLAFHRTPTVGLATTVIAAPATPETDLKQIAPPTRSLSGKNVAEEFVKQHISNPLVRNRSHHEDSRH
jgi:hypothetical protein